MVFQTVPATYPSWDQNPEYIEACRTVRRHGDPTAYNPAHPAGVSPTDVTSFKVGLARWNANNLPDIMYQLWPCEAWSNWRHSARPGPRLDRHGNAVMERWPRPGEAPRVILDYPILRGINQISTKAPWWFIEMLFRLEPRLEWKDLDVLMEFVGQKAKQPIRQRYINSWNMLVRRGREEKGMISWREKSKQGKDNMTRDLVVNSLSRRQIAANTTRRLPGDTSRRGTQAHVPSRQGSRATTTTAASTQASSSQTATANTRTSTSRATTVGRQESSSKGGHGSHAPTRSRKPASPLSDDDLTDADADGDTDEDVIPAPAPKPKRKRAGMPNYRVDDDYSEDSAESEFEPDPEPSRSAKRQKDISEEDGSSEDSAASVIESSPESARPAKRQRVLPPKKAKIESLCRPVSPKEKAKKRRAGRPMLALKRSRGLAENDESNGNGRQADTQNQPAQRQAVLTESDEEDLFGESLSPKTKGKIARLNKPGQTTNRSRAVSEKDESELSEEPPSPKGKGKKRQLDEPEQDAPREKRRRVVEDKKKARKQAQHPPAAQKHEPSRMSKYPPTYTRRQIRELEEQERQDQRRPALPMPPAVTGPQSYSYPSPVSHRQNMAPAAPAPVPGVPPRRMRTDRFQMPNVRDNIGTNPPANGYNSYGHGLQNPGHHSSYAMANGARGPSIRDTANEMGIEPSPTFDMLEQVQQNFANAQSGNPHRSYSDPMPGNNAYRTLISQSPYIQPSPYAQNFSQPAEQNHQLQASISAPDIPGIHDYRGQIGFNDPFPSMSYDQAPVRAAHGNGVPHPRRTAAGASSNAPNNAPHVQQSAPRSQPSRNDHRRTRVPLAEIPSHGNQEMMPTARESNQSTDTRPSLSNPENPSLASHGVVERDFAHAGFGADGFQQENQLPSDVGLCSDEFMNSLLNFEEGES
ncbi:hypothetical protein ACLMJK_001925 [Lecanora helva]